MPLNQALLFKCSVDNIQPMVMVIQEFGDKMESNKSLGFTLTLLEVLLKQELLESLGLW